MQFQIFNNKKQVINLAKFDALYCHESGEKEDKFIYARWFHLLEPAFNIFGDITSTKCYVADKVLGYDNTDTRRVSPTQAVRCLLIWTGTSMFDTDKVEDIDNTYEYVRPFVQFLLNHKDDFYFEFSF